MDYMKPCSLDEDIDLKKQLDYPLHVKLHDPCLGEARCTRKNQYKKLSRYIFIDNLESDDSMATFSPAYSPYNINDRSEDYEENLLVMPPDMYCSDEICGEQNYKSMESDSSDTSDDITVNEAVEESAQLMIAEDLFSDEVEVQYISSGSGDCKESMPRRRGRPPKNLPYHEKVVNRKRINKRSAEKYRAKQSSQYEQLLRDEAMQRENNKRLIDYVKQYEHQIETITAMIPDHMKEIVDRFRQNNYIESKLQNGIITS